MKLQSKELKNNTLGGFLRRSRLEKGMTQKLVSQKLNVSNMFLSNIELNKSPLPMKYLKILSQLYGIQSQHLIEVHLAEQKRKIEKALEINISSTNTYLENHVERDPANSL